MILNLILNSSHMFLLLVIIIWGLLVFVLLLILINLLDGHKNPRSLGVGPEILCSRVFKGTQDLRNLRWNVGPGTLN